MCEDIAFAMAGNWFWGIGTLYSEFSLNCLNENLNIKSLDLFTKLLIVISAIIMFYGYLYNHFISFYEHYDGYLSF